MRQRRQYRSDHAYVLAKTSGEGNMSRGADGSIGGTAYNPVGNDWGKGGDGRLGYGGAMGAALERKAQAASMQMYYVYEGTGRKGKYARNGAVQITGVRPRVKEGVIGGKPGKGGLSVVEPVRAGAVKTGTGRTVSIKPAGIDTGALATAYKYGGGLSYGDWLAPEIMDVGIFGFDILERPDTSNVADLAERYGDEGPLIWAAQVAVGAGDAWYSFEKSEAYKTASQRLGVVEDIGNKVAGAIATDLTNTVRNSFSVPESWFTTIER